MVSVSDNRAEMADCAGAGPRPMAPTGLEYAGLQALSTSIMARSRSVQSVTDGPACRDPHSAGRSSRLRRGSLARARHLGPTWRPRPALRGLPVRQGRTGDPCLPRIGGRGDFKHLSEHRRQVPKPCPGLMYRLRSRARGVLTSVSSAQRRSANMFEPQAAVARDFLDTYEGSHDLARELYSSGP